MRPWLIGGQIGPVELEVDGVERDDEVVGLVDFGEGVDDAWLGPDFPGPVFVADGVVEDHAFLVDDGQEVLVDLCRVVAVEAEALEPRVHVGCVAIGSVAGDGALDYGEAVSFEIMVPLLLQVRALRQSGGRNGLIGHWLDGNRGLCSDCGRCGRHIQRVVDCL